MGQYGNWADLGTGLPRAPEHLRKHPTPFMKKERDYIYTKPIVHLSHSPIVATWHVRKDIRKQVLLFIPGVCRIAQF